MKLTKEQIDAKIQATIVDEITDVVYGKNAEVEAMIEEHGLRVGVTQYEDRVKTLTNSG